LLRLNVDRIYHLPPRHTSTMLVILCLPPRHTSTDVTEAIASSESY